MNDLENDDSFENSRSVLVAVVKDYKVVLEKSMLPKCVQAKELAWEEIKKSYIKNTGKFVTVEQLKKTLQNMKSAVKKKTDTRATGNRPIKLLSWEKGFLDLMKSEENPVFKRVPGAMNVGVGLTGYPTMTANTEEDVDDPCNEAGGTGSSMKRVSCEKNEEIGKKVKKLKIPSESQETAKFTTAELQRWLLLEQIKLTQLQVKREELLLKRELQAGNVVNEPQIITVQNVEDGVAEFLVFENSHEAKDDLR